MRRSRSESANDYRLPLEQIYQFKVFVPEPAMAALSHACGYHNIQAHRGLLPFDDGANAGTYEVLLQISATSKESALSTAFMAGAEYVASMPKK